MTGCCGLSESFHSTILKSPFFHYVVLALAILGLLGVLCRFLHILHFFWAYFVRPVSNLSKYREGKDTWAVVTGSSEGIGKAWAVALARRGFNLILLALGEKQLNDLAVELRSKYNVEVLWREVNFFEASSVEWNFVGDMMEGKDIGVLVNNVGVVNELPGKLHQVPWREIELMLGINVKTTTRFTHMLVERLNNRRRRSAIINMSSSTALRSTPMQQVYGSTKRYIRHLSEAIAAEYKGIDVLSVAPWWVVTSMTKIRRASLTAITPDHLVRSSLRHIGRVTHIDPYWLHGLIDAVVLSLPAFLFNRITMSQQAGVRVRLIRRKEREAKAQ